MSTAVKIRYITDERVVAISDRGDMLEAFISYEALFNNYVLAVHIQNLLNNY